MAVVVGRRPGLILRHEVIRSFICGDSLRFYGKSKFALLVLSMSSSFVLAFRNGTVPVTSVYNKMPKLQMSAAQPT